MVEVRARLWLEKDSKFILSTGRAELLRHIKDTGSIAKAAKLMAMSYSHAWTQIREMSDAAGGALVETARGGRSGGSSKLSKLGIEILKQFEKEMEMLDRHLSERNG